MSDTSEELENNSPRPHMYMFIGLLLGLGFMGLAIESLGMSNVVPLFLLISLMAFASTYGIQAGAVKIGTASIGFWQGSVFAFVFSFMFQFLSVIGFCEYSTVMTQVFC